MQIVVLVLWILAMAYSATREDGGLGCGLMMFFTIAAIVILLVTQ